MRTLGLLLMLSALAMLMAMVVGTIDPELWQSLLSYGLLFAGVFCFTAGVIRNH
ncbi:hypothetical protein DES49_0367 [Halospina denitrificans]|uniref:Uncharacterized protein n=1 Tax=Halospina denitrificans TaxID=332522 RepID=A0A4R7K1D8_9GAMM|nr:hypothetical protein [Halospina denitrificans]TDT44266.1 hypothetical protein DES49_0367 [Halospina denitrificans]